MQTISRRAVLATGATIMAAPTASLGRGLRRLHRNVLDVAIVGGGVSGCYAAWRLSARAPNRSVGVFERSDRIGGRLWSVKPTGMSEQVAELGGMRIANNQTPLLNLTRLLNLTLDPYPATEPDNFFYLRGMRTRAKDLVCSPEFGYRPRREFEGKTGDELFAYALQELTGKTEWTRETFATAKPSMTFQGDPLNEFPYEYVFRQLLGTEASRFLLETTGYGRPNINIVQFLEEGALDLFIKGFKHVRGGYDLVPKGLAEQAKAQGSTFTMGMSLVDLQFDGELTVLTFASGSGPTTEVRAKHVILTIPDTAYEFIDPKSPLSQPNGMTNLLANLLGVLATKVYVNFPSQWWRQLGMIGGRSITDLPMRQCFYLNDPSGRGLTLSPYASGEASEGFWHPLLQPTSKHRMSADGHAGKAIVDQLNEMHGTTVPQPSELIYRTFDGGHVGRGWNMWAPGANVASIVPKARQPLNDRRVFCCGQATAEIQGWVMGTIGATESVLRKNFHLARPGWWPESYPAV
jgi:monoamine oxidase